MAILANVYPSAYHSNRNFQLFNYILDGPMYKRMFKVGYISIKIPSTLYLSTIIETKLYFKLKINRILMQNVIVKFEKVSN